MQRLGLDLSANAAERSASRGSGEIFAQAPSTASMVTSGRLRSWAQVRPAVAVRWPRPAAIRPAGSSLPRGEQILKRRHTRLLPLILGPRFVVDEPQPAAIGRQPAIRIIDAQMQPELRA